MQIIDMKELTLGPRAAIVNCIKAFAEKKRIEDLTPHYEFVVKLGAKKGCPKPPETVSKNITSDMNADMV